MDHLAGSKLASDSAAVVNGLSWKQSHHLWRVGKIVMRRIHCDFRAVSSHAPMGVGFEESLGEGGVH